MPTLPRRRSPISSPTPTGASSSSASGTPSGSRARWTSCRRSTTPRSRASKPPWSTSTATPLDALPDDATHLLWLCYSLVNVSFPVEVWRQPRVPDSGAATHRRDRRAGRLTVLTTEKLGATVGARGAGDRPRTAPRPTTSSPSGASGALDENGALVFRDLHLDDATQVAFSRKLGPVEVFGHGEHPEIFRVTLDPAKNPAAAYLRGTFDWHLDGATDDIPIMATVLSAHEVAASGRRDRIREHLRGVRRPHRRGAGALPRTPRRAHLRSRATTGQPRPVTEGGGEVAAATGQDPSTRLAAPFRAPLARPRCHRVARRGDGRRRKPRAARRPAGAVHAARSDLPPPLGRR